MTIIEGRQINLAALLKELVKADIVPKTIRNFFSLLSSLICLTVLYSVRIGQLT